jgi:hypothetical protein
MHGTRLQRHWIICSSSAATCWLGRPSWGMVMVSSHRLGKQACKLLGTVKLVLRTSDAIRRKEQFLFLPVAWALLSFLVRAGDPRGWLFGKRGRLRFLLDGRSKTQLARPNLVGEKLQRPARENKWSDLMIISTSPTSPSPIFFAQTGCTYIHSVAISKWYCAFRGFWSIDVILEASRWE